MTSKISHVYLYYKLRRLMCPDESNEDSKKIAMHYGNLIDNQKQKIWEQINNIIEGKRTCKNCGATCQICVYGSVCIHQCSICA